MFLENFELYILGQKSNKFYLYYLILLNLVFLLIILLIPRKYLRFIKNISLVFSLILLFYSIFIMLTIENTSWFFKHIRQYLIYDSLYYSLGVDWISIFFVLLTTSLIVLCLLINWNTITYRNKDFIVLLFLLEFFLLNIFLSIQIFFFYIFFEGVLIPMFFIIGIWGARQRKIHAVYQFFFYTFFGSIFMLFAFLLIYSHIGNGSLLMLSFTDFSYNRQILLWICFFLAFAIKVPMVPFHIWLPEAHVEAPTTGSILLAGILLKLGTYGFLRFLISIFPLATKYFIPFVFTITIISVVYGSIATVRQVDLKKIIAYTSVVHMNFAIIGLFSLNFEGLQGSLFLMISHGLISSSLFYCIGILYERYNTRLLYYYGGLAQFMPIYSIIFLIFNLSNMGFPGTSGFIGEFLIMVSIFSVNWKICVLLSLGIFFSGVYSFWLYTRLFFGELTNFYFIYNGHLFFNNYFKFFWDINIKEFLVLFPLFFFNLFLGFYPDGVFFFTKTVVFSLLV